jgi:hypothetical protein
MMKLIRINIYLLIITLLTLAVSLNSGCTANTAGLASITSTNLSTGHADKVEVIYFHLIQRCPTCLCFEERINSVLKNNFNQEINSGKITYQVLNIQDEKNTTIVKKFGAVSAQLFVNRIVDGKDNIVNIQEIWDWNCRGDKTAFDQNIKNLIELSLK